MHYFLLGPSGVGKTTFGDWLQDNRQYLHIPVDRGDQDNGLVTEGLIELWNKLLEGAPPFNSELEDRARTKGENGCVLTFYSVDFLTPHAIDRLAKDNIAVWYLYGPKELCIESYVRRENRPDRDRAFWCQNNRLYEKDGRSRVGPALRRHYQLVRGAAYWK